MRKTTLSFALALIFAWTGVAVADQTGDTTITVVGNSPGVTPFIAQITLNVSDPSVLQSIQFCVTPKADTVTRPFSQTYSMSYLKSRDYLDAITGEAFLPVAWLYSNSTNEITLTYRFLDGSSKESTTSVTAPAFTDPCSIYHPPALQPRSATTDLSHDYHAPLALLAAAASASLKSITYPDKQPVTQQPNPSRPSYLTL